MLKHLVKLHHYIK